MAFADEHLRGRVKPCFRLWRHFLKRARIRKRVEKKARRRARKEAFTAWQQARNLHVFMRRRTDRDTHRAARTLTAFIRAVMMAKRARRAWAQRTIVRAARMVVAKMRVRELRRNARFLGEVYGYIGTVKMRGILRRHLRPWHRALLVRFRALLYSLVLPLPDRAPSRSPTAPPHCPPYQVLRALRALSRLAVKERTTKAWARWKATFADAIRTEHGAARAIQSTFRMHLSRKYVFHYHRWQRAVHRLQVLAEPHLDPDPGSNLCLI